MITSKNVVNIPKASEKLAPTALAQVQGEERQYISGVDISMEVLWSNTISQVVSGPVALHTIGIAISLGGNLAID